MALMRDAGCGAWSLLATKVEKRSEDGVVGCWTIGLL